MKILKKRGGSREKKGVAKSMPHAPVVESGVLNTITLTESTEHVIQHVVPLSYMYIY